MKKKVLIIDDDQDILDLVKQELQRDFEVIPRSFCQDIREACELYQPDLVLIDLMLPGSDGYELCSKIRKFNRDLPVILVTGIELKALKNNYSIIEANDYLLKPFQAKVLREKVEKALKFSERSAEA
ncbi:MAG: response regulator [Candidatus Wallbacteria bacterium]|nr:response regulator [Candidatus Wallbacteria bacterium]